MAERGFSILEALVAMAILAGALLPLLALQGQFVNTTEALERTEQRLAIQNLAAANVSVLNLDQTQSGEVKTQYGVINWRAAPSAGPHPARGAGGFPSRYVITLYDLEITITYKTGQFEILTLQGLGWHPTVSAFDTL